jgi:hypothetical protein
VGCGGRGDRSRVHSSARVGPPTRSPSSRDVHPSNGWAAGGCPGKLRSGGEVVASAISATMGRGSGPNELGATSLSHVIGGKPTTTTASTQGKRWRVVFLCPELPSPLCRYPLPPRGVGVSRRREDLVPPVGEPVVLPAERRGGRTTGCRRWPYSFFRVEIFVPCKQLKSQDEYFRHKWESRLLFFSWARCQLRELWDMNIWK